MAARFSVGEILKDSFSIFFSNIVAFALMAGIILSPAILLSFMPAIARETDITTIGLYESGAILLNFLLAPMVTGAITYGVFQQLRRRHASASDCLATGFRRMFPVLGVSIMSGLAIVAAPLALLLLGRFVPFLGIIAALPCVVIAIYVATMLQVAVPSAVIEKPGVFGALRRSRHLTANYRWPIFGIMFVLGLINVGVSLIGQTVLADTVGLALAFDAVVVILYTGLSATAAALMYYTLRKIKESIDVEEIASVFD
jgi:hypothetical protein